MSRPVDDPRRDLSVTIEEGETIRVLAMDGGGIYGYSTALLLRALCERVPGFLDPSGDHPIWCFAGTSAGALNSLLLAKEENPREFVLAGGLEQFWHRRGTFANTTDPWSAALSFSGLTAWFGEQDFLRELDDVFGTMTLGDLPHRVAISAFNWSGPRTPARGFHRSWRPKIFVNFPRVDEPDRSFPVREVAYGAASPAGLRAVRHGIGDGGVADPDPAMAALVEVLRTLRLQARARDLAEQSRCARVYGHLEHVHMLSLGVCAAAGHYGLEKFNFGPTLFNLLPSNLGQGNWWPPSWEIPIDGPSEAANASATAILERRFFRLDPPLLKPPLDPPTLYATVLARFAPWQTYLLNRQTLAHSTEEAKAAVNRAAAFLRDDWTVKIARHDDPSVPAWLADIIFGEGLIDEDLPESSPA